MSWTEADVPEQCGRTIVVTGANSGIGYEATRVLADRGATVIMACRSVTRGEQAAREIAARTKGGTLVVAELDLADLESVRSFPDRLAAGEYGADRDEIEIDVLINNAGVMAIPREETADGFEKQFGVNHLGHFALTGVLLPHIADGGRVVTVSSGVHERGEIDFDDLQHERSYDKWDAYARSKLANVCFAYELDRRLDAAGRDLTSAAVHPGWADTGLQRRGPELAGSRLRLWIARLANAVFAQSAARGALPTLYAATAPNVQGGEYYGPGGFLNMRGSPERQDSAERSHDRETAHRLWSVSADLTGVTFELTESASAGTVEE